jgi:hypothetical protein
MKKVDDVSVSTDFETIKFVEVVECLKHLTNGVFNVSVEHQLVDLGVSL